MSIKLIAATTQLELALCLRRMISSRPEFGLFISIGNTSEISMKITSAPTDNVIIIDLDNIGRDSIFTRALMAKTTHPVIFTSTRHGADRELKRPTDRFISKPESFINPTGVFLNTAVDTYSKTIYNTISEFLQNQHLRSLPPLKPLIKTASPGKTVLIAASTGGPNALEDVIKALPIDIPPTLIVQHMPSGFTKLFADRLNTLYPHDITEAADGDSLVPGRIMIAPADRHMRLARRGNQVVVECFMGERLHGVIPAADHLFKSAAAILKSEAVGVILTGMGRDGAAGLLEMKKAGVKTIGQNEATCVVYGMPKAAKNIGAIDFELPLNKIPDKICELMRK